MTFDFRLPAPRMYGTRSRSVIRSVKLLQGGLAVQSGKEGWKSKRREGGS